MESPIKIYEELLLAALRLKASVAKHTNVMLHLLGYFKKDLTTDEKQEMLEIIDAYRHEYVPLVVPLDLVFPLCAKIQSAVFETADIS